MFGFTVSGKVRSGDLAGPSRLNLALFSEDNKLYASTFTDETGAYKFEASPGIFCYKYLFNISVFKANMLFQPLITLNNVLNEEAFQLKSRTNP